MTLNVHSLLHLTDCVRELGPLWVFSCFYFENQNGILKSLVHGTQQVDKQILSSFSYEKNLPAAAEDLIPERSTYKEVFEQLYHCQNHCISTKNLCKIGEDLYVIGKSLKDSLTELKINTLSDFSLDNYKAFSRISLNGIKIHAYKKSHHDSAILYVDEHHKIGYGLCIKF